MTAVAADAAKACTRRWSSALNSGPDTVRSNAASTPTASPRKTSGTIRPLTAPDVLGQREAQPGRRVGQALGLLGAQDVAGDGALDGDAAADHVGRDLARGGHDDELVALAQRDEHRARVDERPRRA